MRVAMKQMFSNGRWAMVLALFLYSGTTYAAEPEYMQLRAQAGKAYEIKGRWDTSGCFIAVDIQELPNPRRPKLRGTIQMISKADTTIRVFGRRIEIEGDTEFLGEGAAKSSFDKLKKGQRIEVTCKIDKDDREWEAVSIQTSDVKDSDKLKGTVDRVQIDGESPDTLDMYGLIILLTTETDVNDKNSVLDDKEHKIFKDWSDDYELGMVDGLKVGEKLLFTADARQDVLDQREYDLSTTIQSDASNTQSDLRLKGIGYWTDRIETEAEVRFRKKFLFADERDRFSDNLVSQVTRLNLLIKRIGGVGLSVRVGRQRFDEPREWLFDEYLDAVRVYVYHADRWDAEAAFISSISPVDSLYDSWTDIFAKVEYQPARKNTLSAYILARSDTDVRKREPVYWGLRYLGRIGTFVEPWADAAIMRGKDKGRNLEAWALDMGATFFGRDLKLLPHVTLGYAVGSGDSNRGDSTDTRFRQTGYQDNSARLGGVAAFKYYGEIVNPELSNLGILSAGFGIRPTTESSVDVMCHSYRQIAAENEIKGSNLIVNPNGDSADLGWALTVVIGSPKLWNRLRAALVFERFTPGRGFSPRLEKATLVRLNLNLAV